MLHGLLLVLKIAGIILAVLLGIVLAAAAAVLFVPVRYAADAQYDKNSGKKPVLHVRVTWLLHLFRFFMEYNEGFKMRAQVLFFPLYDSERPIEPEIKEQKEKRLLYGKVQQPFFTIHQCFFEAFDKTAPGDNHR